MNCGIRVLGYYDLTPSILIYDPVAGTVGLVQHIEMKTGMETQTGIEIRAAIDRAAYLRQILLENAEQSVSLALQVELVLAVTSSEEPEVLTGALNEIASETSYLRLIGLNLLWGDANAVSTKDKLRRAFSWLLRDTAAWLKDAAPAAGATYPVWLQNGNAWDLRLTDYRLPRERVFRCEGSAPMHLVYGHNGSGKSSLAEALEVLITGKIQRLDEGGETDYYAAVGHRRRGIAIAAGVQGVSAAPSLPPRRPARAAILPAESTSAICELAIAPGQPPSRTGQPAVDGLGVTSFRLDQRFMDKLVHSNAAERAALFLTAFSPDETRLRHELETKQAAFDVAFALLPEKLRESAQTDRVAWTLREFDGRDNPPERFLPLDSEEMMLLGRVIPALNEDLAHLVTSQEIGKLDEHLNVFATQQDAGLLDTLSIVERVLDEFRNWDAAGKVQRSASYEDDLHRWLELRALSDLLKKYRDVAVTLHRAEKAGWQPQEAEFLPQGKFDDAWIARLMACSAEIDQELNDARAKVVAWQGDAPPRPPASPDSTDSPLSPAPVTQVRRILTAAEIAALDFAAGCLPSLKCPGSLGTLFADALRLDQVSTLPGAVLGAPGGLNDAIAEVQQLKKAVQHEHELGARKELSLTANMQRAQALVVAAHALADSQKHIQEGFFLQIAGGDNALREKLVAAFNEFLALCTPARWAYRDIGLKAQTVANKTGLSLETTDGGRADLLFNTAELNAFALSLFLLLAPRLANPMRLLILDDPLQNMDELTVTTLARALGRLCSWYPDGGRILAFFQGPEDSERIRQETPCAVYELPWLRHDRPSEKRIERLAQPRSTWQMKLQELDVALIADLPRS